MAMDLVARLKLHDDGFTSRMRRVTSAFERTKKVSDTYRDSMGRLRDVNGKFVKEQQGLFSGLNRSTGGMNRFGGAVLGTGRAVSNQAMRLSGLRSQILGVVAAYATATGAIKLFNSTIGEAARFEASAVAIEAIFNDKKLSDSYMEMVDKMAIDSPLLNSTDMIANSKGLVAMTKNLNELGASWSIIEKLQVLDPTQGTDGATFALKEMFQGDSLSMVERFGLNKSELNRIKKLSIPKQITEINKLLDGMGVTEAAINKMGQTTLGYWAQIGERADKFRRLIGESSNSKIGEVLGSVVDKLDSIDLEAVAGQVDARIANVVQKVINFTKKAWEMREPILEVAKAAGTFIGVFAGITAIVATISFLASPIGLVALAIVGIGAAFKAAYKNSETFRGAVDNVVGKVKDLMTAFKTGGTGGLLEAIGISPELIAKVSEFVTGIKSKVSEFVTFLGAKWLELQPSIDLLLGIFVSLKDTAVNIFTSLWAFLQPIFGALGNAFMIIADIAVIAWTNIIAPAIDFVIGVFQALWNVVGPILELLGAAIEVAFGILKIVWDTIIKPVAEYLTSTFATAFEAAQPYVEQLSSGFEALGEIISTIADWFRGFTDALAAFKVPAWLSKLGGGGTVKFESSEGGGSGGKSNYHGIDYVPYDGYQARLHKGESVVTAQENRERKQGGSGGGVVITGNEFHVRQDSDIDAIAEALYEKINGALEAGA